MAEGRFWPAQEGLVAESRRRHEPCHRSEPLPGGLFGQRTGPKELESAGADAPARVITASWVELRSDSLTPATAGLLLDRLVEDFDDYDSVESEDLLSLAANEVAAILASFAAQEVDAAKAWAAATSMFEVLEEYRRRRPVEPFFTMWMEGLRSSLDEVIATTRSADAMEAAQDVLDAAIAQAGPHILEAYELGVLEVDDWEREL